MLTPALILLAALSIFPFIYIIVMSFSRVGLIGGISFHWAGPGQLDAAVQRLRRRPRAGSARSSTSS